MSKTSMTMQRRAVSAAAFIWGFGWFCFFTAIAVVNGYFYRRPAATFWKKVEADRDRYWNLSLPHASLLHAFFTRKNGHQIHYVTNNLNRTERKVLVIFIHGWPDSNLLWHKVIQRLPAATSNDASLVAFDLPGHGGSDGLARYTATEMLEAVTEFILAMKELYPPSQGDGEVGSTIIVGHDWGALIGHKLAAQAPQLADHFILTNAGIPALVKDNVERRVSIAVRMVSTFKHHMGGGTLLRSAWASVQPIARQLQMSSYAFIFNLPRPLAEGSGTLCNLFSLRLVNSIALGHPHEANDGYVAERLASSLGPRKEMLKTITREKQKYGASTCLRAQNGNFFESIRLYREGLLFGRWEKSLVTVAALHNVDGGRQRASSGTGLFDDGPEERLNVPTTVIWGLQDVAMDARLMLDGMADYFVRGSQLITLPDVGHWTPCQGKGPDVLAETLCWVVEGRQGNLEQRVRSVHELAKMTIST